MKISPILIIVAVLVSCVLTYLIYSLCSEQETYIHILNICSFLPFVATLSLGMGISFSNNYKVNINIKVLSLCYFVLFLLIDIGFAIIGVHLNTLVILTSILLLTYFLLLYTIPKKKI